MVRVPGVKICGVTNLEDALFAARAGCAAVGFNFFRRSPRYISAAKAAAICAHLPRRILRVGVFVNSRESTVRDVARRCGLDILQFHGGETPEFCGRFKEYRVIKAFRVRSAGDLQRAAQYPVWGVLLDSFSPAHYGGTGKTFDWKVCAAFKERKQRLFLSGGLTPENVGRAIRAVSPDWVDVASGVEAAPGKKDYAKIERFMREIRKMKGQGR